MKLALHYNFFLSPCSRGMQLSYLLLNRFNSLSKRMKNTASMVANNRSNIVISKCKSHGLGMLVDAECSILTCGHIHSRDLSAVMSDRS